MAIALTSRATVYDRYAISRKFTAQETAINVVQGNISLLVSESEITELKNGNKTMYSKLATVEVDLKSITLAVSSSEYQDINGVLSAITQARASIALNSQQIQLKVSKDSVISSINQTAEAVKINANKIELTGNGVINILNSGTTTINAARLNLNGIITANGNIQILENGSIIANNGTFNNGTFSGTVYASSGTFTGAIYASSGSFNGTITSNNANITGTFMTNNGNKWLRLTDAYIDGGVGSTRYGLIEFGQTYSTTDTSCIRIRGYPHINLMGQIYTSVTPTSSTVYEGRSQTFRFITSVRIENNQLYYTYSDLIFRNGLLTTA